MSARERGFTLIELLLTLAVGSVILTGSVLSIYSIMVTTGRSNNQAVALTDIDTAALAIRNDLLMAQMTDFVNGVPQSSANLTWYDYTSSFGTGFQTNHVASYALSGKELLRNYDGTVSVVGRNVTSISFTQQETERGKLVTVVISTNNSTSPSQTKTIAFSVHLRPEEIQ